MQSPAPDVSGLKEQKLDLSSDGRISGKWNSGPKWPCSLPYGENVSIIGKDEANTIKKLKGDTEMIKSPASLTGQAGSQLFLGPMPPFL